MAPQYTALVVDDNVVNQVIAKRMLQQFGVTTDTAINGQEAVKMCSRTLYDIVLMDVCMPVLDGLEATRQLRENNYDKPILGYTASDISCHKEIFKSGMRDVITKPLRKERLRQVLEDYVFNSHTE